MSVMQTFGPLFSGTQLANALVIATSSVAASATFPVNTANTPAQIIITNFSTGTLFFNVGTAALTAAAVPVASGNAPICVVPPGTQLSFTIDPEVTTISVILDTGTGYAIVNQGQGI